MECQSRVPNTPAVKVGNTVYIGGIAPVDENNLLAGSTLKLQFEMIIKQIKDHLEKFHLTLDNLVFVTVYLPDINLFPQMNEIYQEMIPKPYPARKVIQTPLVKTGSLIEISCIASSETKESV